ncbi:QRFP-like peptide receptor isoform X1 [Coccinella septempunctata]|uniref:QRFP-like peptide receptor isoform X1 n=1 Tax=Coccinella septempunctata TaxID=41139 RepID=UPI001D08689A|nr:QRFP-like peptide receptor isoform X1 [Coccinella septempunctata]
MISTLLALPSTTSSFNPTTAFDFNETTSNFLYLSTTEDDFFFNGTFPNGTNLTFTNFKTPVFPTYLRVISMVFCIIIMCLGVIGNVMVPIVIFKTKDMRNSTNIFLVNLAVADLMVLLVCTPTVLVEVNSALETWVLGREMCKAVPFVELTVAHASVLTILAISFERYYAICKPLKASYICTKARASLICLLAWIIAAVFTSPIIIIAEFKEQEYRGGYVPVCHTMANSVWSTAYFLGIITSFFLIPLIILIVLYCIIAKNLMTNAVALTTNKHIDNYSIRARKQVILMLGSVVASFFICLIPFRVFTLWIILVPPENMLHFGMDNYYNLLYFCRILVYLNSAMNPVLYNLMSSKFRNGFMICSRSKRKFRRTRNGTFSTTMNSCRSSTLRSSNNDYRVSYRPSRNNSLLIKGNSESPESVKSTDSPSHFREIRNEGLRLNDDCIDEECETDNSDCTTRKDSLNLNIFTEEVIICDEPSKRRIFQPFGEPKKSGIQSI